ncbi:MAG: Periplasmic zinc-binding protein TroA [Fimbriimonadaceae bacterium]|nr:Periplasmic zinc-binding protein TroA [Fimbriimonadaceae bacterium]
MLNFRAAAIFLALVGLLAGCAPEQQSSATRKLKVVATTGMVADLAKNVGLNLVEVEAIMGPGVDPHLYKASPGDVQKLADADLVLISGLHLEGKMADVLENLGRKKPVVAVTEGVSEAKLISMPGQAIAHDPHLWFDVELWSECLDPIVEALGRLRPQNSSVFASNATRYKAELSNLHAEVKETIAEIPKAQRVMITAHDAFQYFGRAYDIEVKGIQGISTESEAGLAEINKLVDLIVNRRVKAVFVESSVSQKNVQALVEGAQRRGAAVRVGGQLYSDAMGDPGTEDGTYVGMVRANVRTLVGALK